MNAVPYKYGPVTGGGVNNQLLDVENVAVTGEGSEKTVLVKAPDGDSKVELKGEYGEVVTTVDNGTPLEFVERLQNDLVKVRWYNKQCVVSRRNICSDSFDRLLKSKGIRNELAYLMSLEKVYFTLTYLTQASEGTTLHLDDTSYFKVGDMIRIGEGYGEEVIVEKVKAAGLVAECMDGSYESSIVLRTNLRGLYQEGTMIQGLRKKNSDRMRECSDQLGKDAFQLHNFITDVLCCVVNNIALCNLIRTIAKWQTLHLGSCVLFNMASYCYIRLSWEGKNELYTIIMKKPGPGMYKFMNCLLSFTGVQHHALYIVWDRLRHPADEVVSRAYTQLERDIIGLAVYSKIYQNLIQAGIQIVVLIIEVKLEIGVTNIQIVSLVSSVSSLTLLCLGEIAVEAVKDPANPGYTPEFDATSDGNQRAALSNIWSSYCNTELFFYLILDWCCLLSAGLNLWTFRNFESYLTKLLWVIIFSLCFIWHICGHALFLRHNRSALKHLLGHEVLVFNRAAFIIMLSFCSPMVARLYNFPPQSKAENIGFAVSGTIQFYIMVCAGYFYAIWQDIFAVKTNVLVIGLVGAIIALCEAVWMLCEGVPKGEEISQWKSLTMIRHDGYAQLRKQSGPKCLQRRVQRIKKEINCAVFVPVTFLMVVFAISMYLPFYWLASSERTQVLSIHGLNARIDGEYALAGKHDQKPYFTQQGDVFNVQPVIYFVPKRTKEEADRWIVGYTAKPFQPIFSGRRSIISFLFDALGNSDIPVCEPDSFKTCLAYTTVHTEHFGNYANGTCKPWRIFNESIKAYEDLPLCISRPRYSKKIIVSGRTMANVHKQNIDRKFFGEFQLDTDQKVFSVYGEVVYVDTHIAGLGVLNGTRFWDGYPVYKQSSQSGVANAATIFEPFYIFMLDGLWAIDKRLPNPNVDRNAVTPAYKIHPRVSLSDHSEVQFVPSRGELIEGGIAPGACDPSCVAGCSALDPSSCRSVYCDFNNISLEKKAGCRTCPPDMIFRKLSGTHEGECRPCAAQEVPNHDRTTCQTCDLGTMVSPDRTRCWTSKLFFLSEQLWHFKDFILGFIALVVIIRVAQECFGDQRQDLCFESLSYEKVGSSKFWRLLYQLDCLKHFGRRTGRPVKWSWQALLAIDMIDWMVLLLWFLSADTGESGMVSFTQHYRISMVTSFLLLFGPLLPFVMFVVPRSWYVLLESAFDMAEVWVVFASKDLLKFGANVNFGFYLFNLVATVVDIIAFKGPEFADLVFDHIIPDAFLRTYLLDLAFPEEAGFTETELIRPVKKGATELEVLHADGFFKDDIVVIGNEKAPYEVSKAVKIGTKHMLILRSLVQQDHPEGELVRASNECAKLSADAKTGDYELEVNNKTNFKEGDRIEIAQETHEVSALEESLERSGNKYILKLARCIRNPYSKGTPVRVVLN